LRRSTRFSCAPNENGHVRFDIARVLKGDVMPPVSGTREQGLAIKHAIASSMAANCYPRQYGG
jgi:hypothetical protein